MEEVTTKKETWLKKFLSSLKDGFKDIRTLFAMQIREKMEFSLRRNTRQSIVKIVLFVVEFILVLLLAYGILWLCRYLNLFSPLNIIPISVMSVVVFVLFLFSIITCTVTLSRSLFSADDNKILATYPTSPNSIYISKICVSFMYEIRKTMLFYYPVLCAYVWLCKLHFYAYIWIFFMLIIFTIFEVLLAGIFALPVHYLIVLFTKVPAVKIALAVILSVILIAIVIYIITLIPENINLINGWTRVSSVMRSFLQWFAKYFYIFYAFTQFLCGTFSGLTNTFFTDLSWEVLLVLLACIVVFFIINILISRYLYLRVAIRGREGSTSEGRKEKKNRVRKGFWSSVYYESKRMISSAGNLASLIAVVIAMPLMIWLLNAIYAAIATRLLGDYLTICFNILIVTVFTTSSNVWIASIYSRDGDALSLSRSFPTTYTRSLLPRLMLPIFTTLITCIPASIIFLIQINTMTTRNMILIIFTIAMICIGHLLWSAEMDFTNPRPDLFRTSGTAAINPNEAKSIGLSFGLSLLLMGLAFFFLMFTNSNTAYLICFILALVFFIYRIFVFFYKGRGLFREV